jgi:CheY-like chemotaxis protein
VSPLEWCWSRPAHDITVPETPKLFATHPQFVLLDYHMPEMDGVTLARAIKSDPLIRDVAVVLLTSVGRWSEIRPLEGASIDASLVKPVRQSQLLSTLATVWSKKLEASLNPAAPARESGERA